MLKVFQELGIKPGKHCLNFCEKKDKNRIQLMERKATPKSKQRRKQLRAQRKGFADADEEREGVTYGPGMFQQFIIDSIITRRLCLYVDVIVIFEQGPFKHFVQLI